MKKRLKDETSVDAKELESVTPEDELKAKIVQGLEILNKPTGIEPGPGDRLPEGYGSTEPDPARYLDTE